MLASSIILLFVLLFIGKKLSIKSYILYSLPSILFSILPFTVWFFPVISYLPTGEIQFKESILFLRLGKVVRG